MIDDFPAFRIMIAIPDRLAQLGEAPAAPNVLAQDRPELYGRQRHFFT
jgi:hypothetical protein